MWLNFDEILYIGCDDMFYKLDNQKQKVDISEIVDEHLYIGIMSLEELKDCYRELGISLRSIQRCEDSSLLNQNIIIPHYMYYYGNMNFVNAKDIFSKRDTIVFYIFKNLFLVVVIDDEDNHIESLVHHTSDYVIERNASITRLVYYFLSELMSKDYMYIEQLQKEIELLDKDDSISLPHVVRELSKELLILRNYYDSLLIVGEELQMNYHNLFKKDDMRYFEIYIRKIERYVKSIEMLRELVMQIHDSYTSSLNYDLNKTMQFFTMTTTLFYPLTLMTGWYGMNFVYMPELSYQYGYYVFVGMSVCIVLLFLYWMKKKKYI